jgi:parvulin-like peptidyl-prolyl isomerase
MRLCFAIALFFIVFFPSVAFSQEGAKPEAPLDESVVLKIDDEIVFRIADFERELVQRFGRAFLEQKISEFLLEREAKRLGVSITDEEIKKETEQDLEEELTYCASDIKRLEKELKDRNYTLDRWREAVEKLGAEGGYIAEARKEATTNFEKELAKYGYTIQTRREALTDLARFRLFARRVALERRVQESTLRELFTERYLKDAGTNVWVKVILVSSPPEAEEIRAKAAKMEEAAASQEGEVKKNILDHIAELRASADQKELENANSVVARLRAGEDFAKIAQEKGAGWSKTDFDRGYIKANRLGDQLAPVVEKMKVGEISEPVKSQWGYQVVYLCARKSSDELKFEDVKEQLRAECGGFPVTSDELRELDAKLRESAKITRNLK